MFRITRYSDSHAAEYTYGQFHIVLQKQHDEWKIIQDWDTNSLLGAPLTAVDFEQRAPQF